MKTIAAGCLKSARAAVFGLLLAGLLCASGCASAPPPPPPVTVSEILTLTKNGVPPQEIIRKMHDSRTVYRLRASDLAQLKAQGVSDEVIDYMQQTHLDAVGRDRDYYWNSPPPFGYRGYYDPFWWGYPGPFFIEENHHHEFHEHHHFH